MTPGQARAMIDAALAEVQSCPRHATGYCPHCWIMTLDAVDAFSAVLGSRLSQRP